MAMYIARSALLTALAISLGYNLNQDTNLRITEWL